MTENKRFKIVDEEFISYYGGTGHKISNEECGFWLWHSKIESQKVCDKLNGILDENEQLKSENQSWLKTASHFDNVAHNDRDYAKRMHKENKELKRELEKFKEWEKHIGDVKREDIDRVFNLSIYEIAEAFEYYKERIKKLEKELQE